MVVFITEGERVYCAVQMKFLNMIQVNNRRGSIKLFTLTLTKRKIGEANRKYITL